MIELKISAITGNFFPIRVKEKRLHTVRVTFSAYKVAYAQFIHKTMDKQGARTLIRIVKDICINICQTVYL